MVPALRFLEISDGNWAWLFFGWWVCSLCLLVGSDLQQLYGK